ncbi:hypothetical protein GGI43DRAFT_379518 [Trichoderma evansii]
MPNEETELDKLDDADSVNANEFPLFDERKLKRAFLDRLSELIANEKGGLHVSSSLMIEWPDRVDILVARNNGFKEGDVTLRMLETIASSLRDISMLGSSDPVATSTKQNLWTSLLQSYKPRLKDYMIRAKQALKGTILPDTQEIETLSSHNRTPSLLSRLEEFRALINAVVGSPIQDDLERVVKSAHDVFYLYNEHDFDEITGNNADTRSLRDALGFLGKLQTCFNTLIRSAERFSGFQNLRILPVMDSPTGATKPKMTAQNNAWPLKKTFESLGLELNDKTVECLVGTGKRKGSWTKSELLERFDKLKSSASEVHAEIQVILAATRHDCIGAAIFKYVGCSKLSCFLCYRFVQSHGSYTTRGCHGKLYNLWTVPELPWLAEEERLNLVRALKSVEKAMAKSICDGKTDGLIHARESTIGGSSVATKRQQSGQNPYMISLVSEHLKSQRQGITSSVGREKNAARSEELSQPLPNRTEYEANIDTFCPAKSSQRVLCRNMNNSKANVTFASKRLIAAVNFATGIGSVAKGDRFPDDPETCEHFGLTRCRDWREQSHLMGLYRGLILSFQVEPIQLNEWREKNILMSKIIEKFSKVPEQYRGGYFPWLLRNQHILDNSTRPAKDNFFTRAINAARPYLDPEDRDKCFQHLEPPSKRNCFLVYALALDSSHPNPHWAEFDSWYVFRFVVHRDKEEEEHGLGVLYSQLIGGINKYMKDYERSLGTKITNYPDTPTCSFNEFWLAYKTGSLANLFRQYGLGGILGHDLGLEEFLSFPLDQHELRPSVWKLKHFLALDPNTPLGKFPKVEAAAQEYGFTSRLNAGTRLALRQFYEQLFRKVNPLRVHEAKNCGKLSEYVESTLEIIDDSVLQVLRTFS